MSRRPPLPGDELSFNLHISHSPSYSEATAHDIYITETRDTNLLVSNVACTLPCEVLSLNPTLAVRVASLPLDVAAVNITWTATRRDSTRPSTDLDSNTVSMVYDTTNHTADGLTGRLYTHPLLTGSPLPTTAVPVVSGAVVNSPLDLSPSSQLNIGETVTADLTLDLPEGVSSVLIVVDLPPVVPASVSLAQLSTGASLSLNQPNLTLSTDGRSALIELGDVTNTRTRLLTSPTVSCCACTLLSPTTARCWCAARPSPWLPPSTPTTASPCPSPLPTNP